MLENTSFYYDNIYSTEMKVTNCKVDSGLFQEKFLPSRSIREERIRGKLKPYFMGFDLDPFEFPMTLYFDKLDEFDKRNIASWLMVSYYKPLIFENNLERIFYCMYVGDFDQLHNGLEQGYLQLTMRCNSPFSYTPIYSSPSPDTVYDLSNNTVDGTEIEIINHGDMLCEPLIVLDKVGDGDFSIVNLSDNNREFKMSNLLDQDILEIDNEEQSIEAQVSNVFRYDNHNNIWLRFVKGQNKLMVYGTGKIQFKYRFALYQG